MPGKRQVTHPRMRVRSAGAIVATAAALGGFASFAAPGLASTRSRSAPAKRRSSSTAPTISTSNLTIAQLAKLQGVPAATVQLELDGVAADAPAAQAVAALIAGLPLETTLATALDDISKATGGAVSPQSALRQVIEDEGTPRAAGANGGNGAAGAGGANGAGAGTPPGASTPGGRACPKHVSLPPVARTMIRADLARRARALDVPLREVCSSPALAERSRKIKSGANVLTASAAQARLLRAAAQDGWRRWPERADDHRGSRRGG